MLISQAAHMARGVHDDAGGVQGEKLFKQLFRLLPHVKVEDYFSDGTWRLHQLEVDLELVAANRREAGAPEPPPISEIAFRELPIEMARTAPPWARSSSTRR